MPGWVMLESPGLMILYGLGLGAAILDERWHSSKGMMTFLAGAAVIISAALLILNGASLWEAAAWLIAFLLVIMGVKT